jgi:hypothetical protein
MGIASGMHLREHIASATLRLEVLCVLFLCYWKWPAACILKNLIRHVEELLGADAQGRQALYERSWKEAMLMLRPTEFSVVCNRRQGTVELLPRAKVRRFGGAAADPFFSHNLLKNPAKRRTAEIEFGILMEDLRSGRLVDAIAKLAESFAAYGATVIVGERASACLGRRFVGIHQFKPNKSSLSPAPSFLVVVVIITDMAVALIITIIRLFIMTSLPPSSA